MIHQRQPAFAETTRPAPLPVGLNTAAWLGVMVVLWGLSWPATKLALVSVPPLWLASLRFGSAALCLFVVVALKGQLRLPPKADWPIVASIGLLQMMAFTGLGMIAMTHTDTSRAVVLAYTTPLWAVVVNWLMFRQAPSRQQAAALAIGISGIAIICSPLEIDWTAPQAMLGSGLLVIGAVFWSVVILHVRSHRWTSSPLALAPWQMLLAAIPLTIAACVTEGSPLAIPVDATLIKLLLFIGPVATSACFVIAAEHGRRITPFAMSNLTLGVPLVGIAASVAFLGSRLSAPFLLGLGLIVSGMVYAAISSRSRPFRQETAVMER
ncbi:DMT family transporter [Insolitispirillum peregrinum]|uniref:DMT family transporter n=1 Tax=Insolitispirillum peregrinum TaxID=80876 RepID=UPI00361FF96E